MSSDIQFAELERRINENLEMLVRAQGSYHVGRLLYSSIEQHEFEQYKSLLTILVESLLDSSIVRLRSFYPGRSAKTSIVRTMEKIVDYCNEYGETNGYDVNSIIEQVSQYNDLINTKDDKLSRLKRKRNKEIAHRDPVLVKEKQESWPLYWEDLEDLIDTAIKILNGISQLVLGHEFCMNGTRQADLEFQKIIAVFQQHKFLFETLEKVNPELLLAAIYYKTNT